jgi:hAT family C-terminal dimerisation region/Domain of unknown function (DUF4413)
MLDRAVYLQTAIDAFVESIETLSHLKLTQTEWHQAQFLLDLLLPFNACNDRMEQTIRPGIDKVFPTYETLFNELDRLTGMLANPRNKEHRWMKAVHPALVALKLKLKKYYGKTHGPYVYAHSIILNPRWKLSLFLQESWDRGDMEMYRAQCRARFTEEYEDVEVHNSPFCGQKRSYPALDDEGFDSDEEYETLRQSLSTQKSFNEFDHYIQLPRIDQKVRTLDWWRHAAQQYPKLARMARDYHAVSATGAGVERQFSRSGRVTTSLRSRLNSNTIRDIMLYKDYLARRDQDLKFWKGARMGAGEEIEMTVPVTENQVPKDWKDRWWLERGHRFSKPN